MRTVVDGEDKVNQETTLDKASCEYGDYHLKDQYFFVCLSARGWSPNLKINVVYTKCQSNCPPPIDDDSEADISCPDNTTVYEWSNAEIWSKGRLPVS